MRRLPCERRYYCDDETLAATGTGNDSIDEAAANLLRSLQEISDESDGGETPRTFNSRLREAAISGSSFHASPLRAGRRARMRAEGRSQILPSSSSMPDLSNSVSSSTTEGYPGQGARLRNAGQTLFQQGMTEQPGHRRIFHGSPQSTTQDTRISMGETWDRDWAPLRKDCQLQLQDERAASKDDWLWRPAHITPATSSTAASSSVDQRHREVGHVREELLSLMNLHAKTVEELSNLNRQLSWTQTELQKREHMPGPKAQEQNDELVKLRAGLSKALVDRDRLHLEVKEAWAESARFKTQLLNTKDQTDQRPDAEQQKAEPPKLHSEFNQCKTDLVQARKERDRWEAEVLRIRPELQQQQTDLCNLRMKLSQALAEPGQYKMELAKAREETSRLEAELQRVRSEDQQHNADLCKSRLELGECGTALAQEQNAGLSNLRSKVTQALADLDNCRAKLLQARAQSKSGSMHTRQALQQQDDELSEALEAQRWRHSDLCSELSEALAKSAEVHNAEPSQLRSQLLEALAELDQSKAELRQAELRQSVPELERPHNHEPDELRSELSDALAELGQSRLELEQVRLQSCAAAAAEDELPKVLEHCSRQEKLLQKLSIDFATAQEQLVEKGKALEELKGWDAGDLSNMQLMSSAYSTMKSIRSANTSLRSTMRETLSHNGNWALEGGQSTWGEWPHQKGSKRLSALARIPNRMSRSQVSFVFDKNIVDEESVDKNNFHEESV